MTATRITYDTEFNESNSKNGVELISIGMVNEATGETIYAVSRQFDVKAVLENKWLRENVWPSLPTKPCPVGQRCHEPKPYNQHLDRDDPDVRPLTQIARMVERFITKNTDPQLWAYYGSYDHYMYARLFGTMKDLPEGCPMFTMDIKQEMVRLGLESSDMPQQASGDHNALADAQHNLALLQFLDEVEKNPQILPRRLTWESFSE